MNKSKAKLKYVVYVEFSISASPNNHIQTKVHLKAVNNDTSEKVVDERKQEYQKNYYESKKDELREKVECKECGVVLNKSSMKRHIKRKHS